MSTTDIQRIEIHKAVAEELLVLSVELLRRAYDAALVARGSPGCDACGHLRQAIQHARHALSSGLRECHPAFRVVPEIDHPGDRDQVGTK